LKRTAALFVTLVATMVIISLTSFYVQSARASSSYSIESVDHNVSVLYNGYVLINDTIAISGQTGSFSLGFPYEFGSSLIEAIAYDASDSSNLFPVTLNTPLKDDLGEDSPGFYGVSVDFSKGTPQTFSVIFVFSHSLLTQDSTDATKFTLVFPAFPSLTQTIPVCNCSIDAAGGQYLTGTISSFTYDAASLPAFTYNTSTVEFQSSTQNVTIFEIQQLNRVIDVNEFGETSVSDAYYITNNSTQSMSSVEIVVPPNASNLQVHDQLGRVLSTPLVVGANPTRYQINFTLAINITEAGTFTVNYGVPSGVYVKKQGTNDFAFNMTFFEDTNIFIEQASVSFVLPEGTQLSSFETTLPGKYYSVSHNIFQQTMTVNEQNIVSSDGFSVSFNYEYNPLWLAFRPTMWVWAVAIVGAAILAVWRRPGAHLAVAAPSATLGVRLRAEDIRAFVDAYEEKLKIGSEIDALDSRVQKGRIPRRRYKVQKKTLETRLGALDRTLAEIGGRMHSAGTHYSDLMRQLEVAETEIDEVEANMRSIETRQGRGEISLETYHKLLGDYERRKERCKTTINGILLRLREEI